MRIVSIGEVLWDVFPDREFLGGAPLNFAAAAQRLGSQVALFTAVGDDARGARALEAMKTLGLTTEFVQTLPGRATGTALVVTDDQGNASYVIPRPAAFDCLRDDNARVPRLAAFQPDWIYFGTLAQTCADTERLLGELVEALPGAHCFYDLNLRTGHWNLPLVQRLSQIATVLKLNLAEAEVLFHQTLGAGPFSLEEFCRSWSATYGTRTLCVTLGSEGCAVFQDGRLQAFPGVSVQVVDTVGAGDAFAAAFLHGLHLGWPIPRMASFANAVGALVASRSGATPDWTINECLQLIPPAMRWGSMD